jgi:hypothetical protein
LENGAEVDCRLILILDPSQKRKKLVEKLMLMSRSYGETGAGSVQLERYSKSLISGRIQTRLAATLMNPIARR